MKSVKVSGTILVEVKFYTDPHPIKRIVDFVNCPKCLKRLKSDDANPSDTARLEVGVTDDGMIQVWCHRHQINVMTFVMKAVEEDLNIEEVDEDIKETVN